MIVLKYIHSLKIRQREMSSMKNRSNAIIDKMDEEQNNTNQINEITLPNTIIKNILFRNFGDNLLLLISLSFLGNVLFENFELYKIFVFTLLRADPNLMSHILFNEPLGKDFEILKMTRFKANHNIQKSADWNFALIFKAFSSILLSGIEGINGEILQSNKNFDSRRNMIFLKEDDYNFLKYLFGDSLNPAWSENWKKGFIGFSKYILQDLMHPDKCERSLLILEKFLYFDAIQKHVSEEIYEQLRVIIQNLISLKNKRCLNLIENYLNNWFNSPNSGSMLRDSLRRLLELRLNVN